LSKLKSAELFAKEKHVSMTRKDGKTHYSDHLESVVNRLKNLGITDEDVLAAAWLHDAIEDTNTTFDDIEQRFGSKVAVLVLVLSKDKNLPKGQKEEQYTRQLKNASWEAQLIKLCDISANLKDLKSTTWSKTKKSKEVKRKIHYLNVIKPDLIKIKPNFPGIQSIVDGINDIIIQYR
jgi:(p)ppGpp synthase/HD superfamily hydrolase